MDAIIKLFQSHPELGIFLSLAIGYFIGRLKFGNFSLGTVTGTLLAALVVGQMGLTIDPFIKTVAFDLFLFALGYSVGPQFFAGLKKDGIPQLMVALIISAVGLAAVLVCARVLGLDAGTAAGLASGALTHSAVIGTATAAIEGLAIPDEAKQQLLANMPISYAICYPFGTVGIMLFLTEAAPKLLGIDFRAECKKFDTMLAEGKAKFEPGMVAPTRAVNVRAYQVTNPKAIGKTVAEVETAFADNRVFVERLERQGQLLEITPDTQIQFGDVLALAAKRGTFTGALHNIGNEVDQTTVLDFPAEALNLVITNKRIIGKTLGEVAALYGHGLYLSGLTRQGRSLPHLPGIVLARGDVLKVAGAKQDVEQVVNAIGYPERPTIKTDIVYMSIGVFLGILVGLITITVAGVPLTLSTGGGCLLAGLVFGWLHAAYPVAGQLPEGAQWILSVLGLTLFIAVVGISAGPAAVNAAQTRGAGYFLSIFIAGCFVTLLPGIACILLYRLFHFPKLNPVLLEGAVAGGQTTTACLNALSEKGESNSPTLGYTVSFAVGNILLTVLGPIVVALVGVPNP